MVVATESIVTDPQTILQLLAYGVCVVGPDWRVLYANPEADRILGAHGATLWERCPDLEHTAFASGFRYAMADRTELLSESALPTVGWCQARALPTADGGLLITLKPISAHNIDTGQAKQALVMGEIGDALTREESLRAALMRCAAAIHRQLDIALVRIWTVDHDQATLDMCGTAGFELHELQRIAIGDYRPGQIAESGTPFLTNDAAADLLVGNRDWIKRERISAFAGYPLRVGDSIVGVMGLYSRRLIDHDLLNSMSSLADALALGIARKTSDVARRKAEERARKQAADLELLHALGQELVSELDLDHLAQKVVDVATELAGAQYGVFFYNRPDEFMLYALSGISRSTFETIGVPRSTPLLAPTFVERKTVRVDDLRASELYAKLGPPPAGHPAMTSYLGVPVVGREGRRLGALLFGHERAFAFSLATQRLVEGVASTAAIAMDNARMFGEALSLIGALEKSNRELDQFAYIASHDLKAPLRGIANLAQWIEDDLEGKMDDSTREHLHLLRGRVTRLENLIGGILAYSRAGRDPRANLQPLDVGALARECAELLAPPERVTIDISPELPTVHAPRPQLQQVLMNLIGNAIKYNPDAELTIEVGTRGRIGRFHELFVRDNGVGIASEFHEKIWGLFQTLERRDKIESTGIGLSIVRKIVEAQGGTTRVESRPGEGATFLFTWPAELTEERR